MHRKEVTNYLFDSAPVTVGVLGLSMLIKRVFREKLTDATSLKDTAKLAFSVAVSTMLVKWAQSKKHLPTDLFNTQ